MKAVENINGKINIMEKNRCIAVVLSGDGLGDFDKKGMRILAKKIVRIPDLIRACKVALEEIPENSMAKLHIENVLRDLVE